jgi:hypothetical protein
MLEKSRERLLATLGPDQVVLDIGGWADPFERADWVIDLMPYETRGLYTRKGWIKPREPLTERFTKETWIERDLCDREPYPFADDSIDFVICSQTLEDLRDPVWVCEEMARIAKAGYIEVPSRLEEQSWGVAGRFVGWSHHRWLIDVVDGGMEFVLKPHSLHSRKNQYFPSGFLELLSDEERVETLWWENGLTCHERVFFEDEDLDRYLREPIVRELPRRAPQLIRAPSRPRRRWWRK